MNIDNKRALIILVIVIIILTAATIIVGKLFTTVEVEPKNMKVDNNIAQKIDWIVEGDTEKLNEEEKEVNVIDE